MNEDAQTDTLLFVVQTPLGFTVRVTRQYWEYIITIKHPVMVGHEERVREALQTPSEIRRSKSDPQVFLCYKPERIGRWICAVIRQLNGEGFLITTYPTDAIKEGYQIWPK